MEIGGSSVRVAETAPGPARLVQHAVVVGPALQVRRDEASRLSKIARLESLLDAGPKLLAPRRPSPVRPEEGHRRHHRDHRVQESRPPLGHRLDSSWANGRATPARQVPPKECLSKSGPIWSKSGCPWSKSGCPSLDGVGGVLPPTCSAGERPALQMRPWRSETRNPGQPRLFPIAGKLEAVPGFPREPSCWRVAEPLGCRRVSATSDRRGSSPQDAATLQQHLTPAPTQRTSQVQPHGCGRTHNRPTTEGVFAHDHDNPNRLPTTPRQTATSIRAPVRLIPIFYNCREVPGIAKPVGARQSPFRHALTCATLDDVARGSPRHRHRDVACRPTRPSGSRQLPRAHARELARDSRWRRRNSSTTSPSGASTWS